MADFLDTHHRPHAKHTGQSPTTRIDFGPHALRVTLDTWGPQEFADTLARYLDSNWGDAPVPTNEGNLAMVADCFAGQTLQQVLEGLTFWFTIDGCTRAATHQIVRTRDAAFMQHGGRDNDWRHRAWTMPETIRRACFGTESTMYLKHHGLHSCISANGVALIKRMIDKWTRLGRVRADTEFPLYDAIDAHLEEGKELYAVLVDSGIPWQDARRILTMGTQTYIHAIYCFPTLQHTLANRLEHIMDWEINCIAQLMLREIYLKCPPIMRRALGSHSDKAQAAKFAGLSSWPPDGKWPVPEAMRNILREHTPEQMPFFVLHPRCFTDTEFPVEWIPTNGQYPQLQREQMMLPFDAR